MAMKKGKPKSGGQRQKKKPNLIDRLESAEAADVLRRLLAGHPELRPEAEAIARSVLGEVSLDDIAGEVEGALLQFDYDDLNSRAGAHSWGYVEPTEAAWEMLDEAVAPFIADMKRHLELGLEEEARQCCQGILLGLYRVRAGAGNDVMGWAADFPAETAEQVLKEWKAAGARSAVSGDFVAEHVPEWGWIAETTPGEARS